MTGFQCPPCRGNLTQLLRQFHAIRIFCLLQVQHCIDSPDGQSGVSRVLQIRVRPRFRQFLTTAQLLQTGLKTQHHAICGTRRLLFKLSSFFGVVGRFPLLRRLSQKRCTLGRRLSHGIHQHGQRPGTIFQIAPRILQSPWHRTVQHIQLLILQQLIAQRFCQGLQLRQSILRFHRLLQLISAGSTEIQQSRGMADNRFRQIHSLLLQQTLKGFQLSDQQRLLTHQPPPRLSRAADDEFLMLQHHLQIIRCRIEDIPRCQPRKMFRQILRVVRSQIECSLNLVQLSLL